VAPRAPLTNRFQPVKRDQQIVVVCDSASIATGDISGVLPSLKSLSGDRSGPKVL
jgi:hypothetical protein